MAEGFLLISHWEKLLLSAGPRVETFDLAILFFYIYGLQWLKSNVCLEVPVLSVPLKKELLLIPGAFVIPSLL